MHVWQFSWQNCAGLSANSGMFYLACLFSPTFSARVQCWPLHSKLVTISICQVIWIKHNAHIFWSADGLASSLEDTTIWCDLSNPQLLEVLKMLHTLDWEIQNVSDCAQLWHIWYNIVQYPRGHKLSKDSTLGKADGSIELTRIQKGLANQSHRMPHVHPKSPSLWLTSCYSSMSARLPRNQIISRSYRAWHIRFIPMDGFC